MSMVTCHTGGDAAENLLERRWFAARRAASEVQAECDAIARVLDIAQGAWRGARARLSRLEALRDALGEELAETDERVPLSTAPPQRSAA